MKHFLFIVESIPDKLFLEKLGINFYKKKGVKVDILYIAAITRKEYYSKIKFKNNNIYFNGYNKAVIINYLKKNVKKNSYVFLQYRQNFFSYFIYNFLKNTNCKKIFISWDNVLIKKKSIFDILKILLFSPFLFSKLLLRKIIFIKNSNLNYDYIFTAGQLSYKKYFKSSKKLVHIPHYDLDFFNKSKKNNIQKNYFVFISPASINPDSYDKNPGYVIKNKTNFKNNYYFYNIKNVLKKISNVTKFKALIAKHPKDKFNLEKILGLKCYDGITPALVKNAKFCCCFDSSAFQFAIIAKKPILFFLSKSFAPSVVEDIYRKCDFFRTKPILIDKNIDNINIKKFTKFDNLHYKKYFRLYISDVKKNEGNLKSYEIIFKNLQ